MIDERSAPMQGILSSRGGFRKLRGDSEQVGDRKVRKYHLEDKSLGSAQQAYASIIQARDTKSRVPLFTMDSELFYQTVQFKPYLIRSGNALILSSSRAVSADTPIEFVDKYISFGVLEHPVRCPDGHVLEREDAVHWISQTGRCPGEYQHPVTVDQLQTFDVLKCKIQKWQTTRQGHANDIQASIQAIVALQNRLEQMEKEVDSTKEKFKQLVVVTTATNRIQQQENDRLAAENDRLAGIRRQRQALALSGAGKAVIKSGASAGLLVAKAVGKEIVKQTPKQVAKAVAKYLPVIGLFIGIGLGIYRLFTAKQTSDYIKAGGEVVSGLACCWPGYGTAIAIGLDLSMAAHDMYGGIETKPVGIDPTNIQDAYFILGLVPDDEEPTQQSVDSAYRANAASAHGDNFRAAGGDIAGNVDNIRSLVNQARDTIYQHRGWQA